MDAFTGLGNELVLQLAFAIQGFLILFCVVSPVMGKLIHIGVAKFSTLVLIVCTMFIVANLSYMGMVYVVYPTMPSQTFHLFVWIILSFLTALSLSALVGRYMNWFYSDNFNRAIWIQEYDALTDVDMMPFDRRRKQEMERRKRSRHEI